MGSNKSNHQKIEKLICAYLRQYAKSEERVNNRYSSYDYCYAYFNKNRADLTANKELSCLHLGMYLASWGMYRGSSGLLQKSYKIYEELIEHFCKHKDCWELDIEDYENTDNLDTIIGGKNTIKDILKDLGISATDTLLSKIMMGVYGCVPAYDQFFIDSLRRRGISPMSFSKDGLAALYKYVKDLSYFDIEIEVENGNDLSYTKAKIIDQVFWFESYMKNIVKNSKESNYPISKKAKIEFLKEKGILTNNMENEIALRVFDSISRIMEGNNEN